MTDRELAVTELLGALTYGQLRSFEVTARAIRHAPDARAADRLADFAVREHTAYATLRNHLRDLTDLPAAVIDRQKPRFDAYFNQAPVDEGWVPACAFFAVGLPLAADFIRQVAPTLPPETALVVVGALADRRPFEDFSLQALTSALEDGTVSVSTTKHLVADILGRALTGFQGAIGETDALKILLADVVEDQHEGERLVKRMAITVLENHRRRMHALGLEDLD